MKRAILDQLIKPSHEVKGTDRIRSHSKTNGGRMDHYKYAILSALESSPVKVFTFEEIQEYIKRGGR